MGDALPARSYDLSTGQARDRDRSADPVADAVGAFGRSVANKLGRGGGPEDQLRAPLEQLLLKLGTFFGLPVTPYGEVSLRQQRARPDYGVDVGEARVGYIELKQPDKKIPPDWNPDSNDKRQWGKLQSVPNLIYTNGVEWAHFSYGVLQGEVVHLGGSLEKGRVQPSDRSFELMIRDFLLWKPLSPRTLQELIKVVAGLCSLLRDEVAALLAQEKRSPGKRPFAELANTWRGLLFPTLTDARFPDAYAQTVTFAFLLARASGAIFEDRSLPDIADQLGKSHPLMGRALAALTHTKAARELRDIDTLRRVIGPVSWDQLEGATSEYWVIYEGFLAEYDPKLRQESGSYYTPDPVARFMIDFVDQILKTHMRKPRGFAADNVVVVDPAMGTGTFLVEAMRAAASTMEREQSRDAVEAHLRDLYRRRLVGLERQAAPFAVAELRLHQTLREVYKIEVPDEGARFLADALDDPNAALLPYGPLYDELVDSREGASRVKREERVMAVITNPPYLERAGKRGPAPWITERRQPGKPVDLSRPSLDDFRLSGAGQLEFNLANQYVYFWRLATWKVFDAHPDHPMGVVAFITPSAYLTSEAFAGMRRYLRRTADAGWIVDVSPEWHRSSATTRIFPPVQHPLCIGVFARYGKPDPEVPAHVQHLDVRGTRKEKFAALTVERIQPAGQGWRECRTEWTEVFVPISEEWACLPKLGNLMPWQRTGVNPNRTWVYAPDEETLRRRWEKLIAEPPEGKDNLLKVTDSRSSDSLPKVGPPFSRPVVSLRYETNISPLIVPTAFRSFDRQFMILDVRVIDRVRSELWGVNSECQVFVVEQHAHPIEDGPGLTFGAYVPNVDHFNSRGGRVIPLYRDAAGRHPNIAPGLLRYLHVVLGTEVTERDFLAYVAAVVAHPGYTRRFKGDLAAPGIRVPLTADSELWQEAVEIGREVLWLHTYGQRYMDRVTGCPPGPPRLSEEEQPRPGPAIPATPDRMPDRISYDASAKKLHVGDGVIAPVSPQVWEYTVAGMHVIRTWFESRRRKPRHKRRSSDLDATRPEEWTYRFTDDLLNLLNVLGRCVALEPHQIQLLERVCVGPLITTSDLKREGIFPLSETSRRPPRLSGSDQLPES